MVLPNSARLTVKRVRRSGGGTVLHVATERGNLEIIKLLIT